MLKTLFQTVPGAARAGTHAGAIQKPLSTFKLLRERGFSTYKTLRSESLPTSELPERPELVHLLCQCQGSDSRQLRKRKKQVFTRVLSYPHWNAGARELLIFTRSAYPRRWQNYPKG